MLALSGLCFLLTFPYFMMLVAIVKTFWITAVILITFYCRRIVLLL